MDQNYAAKLTIPNKKRPDGERDPFTADELQTLFNGYLYQGEFPPHTKPHPYQFWLPLLGLFTGACIEELCKPRLEDIRQVDGIWCLEVKDAKTEAGERLIPVHQRLINLGFIDYVNSRKEQGQETDQLFLELRKERDGHSQSASKWFARYRKRYGVGGSDGKKCFHSFRHTVIDCLKQRGDIPHEHVTAVVGHKDDDVTYGRYGKAYRPPALVKAVNAISFPGLSLSHISFDDFQRRKKQQKR